VAEAAIHEARCNHLDVQVVPELFGCAAGRKEKTKIHLLQIPHHGPGRRRRKRRPAGPQRA
jgi:hypothetical protein